MLTTIIVEDEAVTRNALARILGKNREIDLAGELSRAADAINLAREKVIDFALLDIEMPGMDGLRLGNELKSLHPEMVIIYVTAHDKYILDTIKVKADYFILKPFCDEDIDQAVKRALLLSKRQQKRVVITAFGNFEVYVDSQRVKFRNASAKELLAYCVNARGSEVAMEVALETVWEGREHMEATKRLYRKAIGYLDAFFEAEGLAGVFKHTRGCCWLDASLVSCDYFDYLNSRGKQTFNG